ncbi:MAG: undecaprenyl/decaprenyl-phosphate alpha-N-acetylglucosaminyl 1-phosphate transferase [Acidobacteria bacterium]|nr:undecaprenyl/decaprenyl-phosphate alpha-N-acetylglucosaminyl 1-phosphate transferase [Acidobacteriota bacterium]
MRSYVTLFTISLLLAFALTPIVRRRAIAWGAIDVPDSGRRIHSRPTPRLGGIAIFVAFLLTLACVPLLDNLVGESFRANLPKLAALLIPATLMFFVGVYDDFRSLSAPQKIVAQVAAAAILYSLGIRIDALSSPFGGTWLVPGLLAFPLTALWIVLITNAFNLIDGIDGLAAGASVFALLSILVFSIAQGNPEISLVAVVLVGAVIGFLRYNFNPATIFLGDSGSLFLGFMAAALSIAGSQKGSTIIAIAIPLVSFGLPVVEAGLSLIRRFLGGDSLLAGDGGHIHHMLLRRGMTQRQAVILLYGVCAVFSLFGLMLLNPQRNLAALIFFVLGVGIVFGVQHLQYTEFSVLGTQIRDGVRRRRRALTVNVKVRRTSATLAAAQTPEQFFAALEAVQATEEFDAVVLEVGADPGALEPFTARFRRWSKDASRRIVWVWQRDETPLAEILDSDEFWTLRVPLSSTRGDMLGAIVFYRRLDDEEPMIDLRHICGPLQRELAAALERLTEHNAVGPSR